MAAIVDPTRSVPQTHMALGIDGLDQIFCGGLLRGHSLVLQGPPGSAKTTLGTQILYNGLTRFGEKGIILSFEQQPEQIARDAQSFGWNLTEANQDEELVLLFARPRDLYPFPSSGESELLETLRQLQERIGARRILIDSITHFFRTTHPIQEQDSTFVDFLLALQQMDLTPILIAEQPDPNDSFQGHSAHVVDAVIHMHHDFDPRAGQRRRWLEVTKSRGQQCIGGRHPFQFCSEGIEVFPRLMPYSSTMDQAVEEAAVLVNTGVEGIDVLLKGGLAQGSVATIAGPEGTAKTTLGAHFLAAGCKAGERTLLLSFEESPWQLVKNMTSRGLALLPYVRSGQLEIMHRPPTGVCLLETYHTLKEIMNSRPIRRIVIDNLNDLLRNADDEQDEHYFYSLFCDLFRRNHVTAVFLEQIPPSSGLESFAAVRHASLVDTIIMLGFAEAGGRLAKSLIVMKSRNEIADSRYHELVLTPEGAKVRMANE